MYFSVSQWEFWVDSVDNWEWFPYCRREGFNLLVAHENPMERRQKLITLTPKGRVFLNKLLEDR